MDVRWESLFPSPVLHPGIVLRQEFLERYGISQGELAKAIGVEPTNLCAVIHGRRSVTLELARLLAAALGTSPEYWLLRQLAWDLDQVPPLPPVARMPQIPEPTNDRWAARTDLYLSHRPGSWRVRSLREPTG